VDVRSRQEYLNHHIEGALNIAVDQLDEKLNELKDADLVITTCGTGGGRSTEAAKKLSSYGIPSKWLHGGTFGWSAIQN